MRNLCILEKARNQGSYVFPANFCLAGIAVHVDNGMQSRHQHAIFSRPKGHIHHFAEKICSS
jgi:hypothetical protein